MSLYHEAASVLQQDPSTGGNLRSRVFNKKDLKSPPNQVYALALETCKWSALTPVLSLLLVHDFLLAKGGIALPASHGLRVSIDRHKSRLNAEFTRARIRRKCSSVDALREQVETSLYANSQHPRWIRVNTLRTTLEKQLYTTFKDLQKTSSVQEVFNGGGKLIYIDEHVPNLVAVSPRFDFARCHAYKTGQLILQDKASCFPAYLLDPKPSDGDFIDGCAAPGNKTTHAAAIIKSQCQDGDKSASTIHAFEKDARRAKTLDKMVKLAGSDDFTQIHQGQDFLKVDPSDATYANTGAILLDPSCSGSGIVGRDDMPELHLPAADGAATAAGKESRKRKRPAEDPEHVLIDDDGNTTLISSEKDLEARLEALSSFQLTLLLHAFSFPAACKITYSTCSVHAEENEQVVLKALQSDVGKRRGWRVLPRDAQASGMQTWPVRGQIEACDGDEQVAESCIRAYKDDGRGVMGFFVAAFERDPGLDVPSPNQPAKKEKSRRREKVTKNNQNSQTQGETHPDPPSESPSNPNANGRGIDVANTDDDDSDSWSGFDD
ncbi:NOL1/NOP2/sun family protein [Diaporthe helianthi]|uniref:NOL1/NOP2/sun family protein n=1 Tax=Diaporthe helianthi TaxID=158607 RepID=A0A2P5I241_DIAHE|nr:NOL1/NOP2/sun family protein [Diaporthe helianthi]